MKYAVPDFSQAHVLIVGDLMLDRYWYGSTGRISPEAPVPVVSVFQSEERPGGAGNVAFNVASLNANSNLTGLAGDDADGVRLTKLLEQSNVKCLIHNTSTSHTIVKLRVLSQHQQLIRLDFENTFSDQDLNQVYERFAGVVGQNKVVVLSDYGKGCLGNIQRYINTARQSGVPVIVDPKGRDFSAYRNASILTPNRTEFELVTGPCRDDAELEVKGRVMVDELTLDALLITCGDEGMTLIERNGGIHQLPAEAREVFDVTGAGDTVVAVLAASLAAGVKLPEAVALANTAAGIVVGKLGSAAVTPAELRRALNTHGSGSGVLTEQALLQAVQDARAHGESVIMTNGCFDILHAGHVRYLEQAALLGERLIVAVNVDEIVRKLKGPDRPVNSLASRMAVLAGLAAVDWVVPFSEDTPERLICAVKPDALVKGGDNVPGKIPGSDCVRDAGGKVLVMDYLDGLSTTSLIHSIRKRTSSETQ